MLPWHDALFAILLAVTPARADRDEPPEARGHRLDVVTSAIETAATEATGWPGGTKAAAALLASLARNESGLAKFVHAGDCNRREWRSTHGLDWCDQGRARTLFQLRASNWLTRELLSGATGEGLEATTQSARYAMRLLSEGYARCKSVEGAVAAYATGKSCRWIGAPARVKLAKAYEAKLLPNP